VRPAWFPSTLKQLREFSAARLQRGGEQWQIRLNLYSDIML